SKINCRASEQRTADVVEGLSGVWIESHRRPNIPRRHRPAVVVAGYSTWSLEVFGRKNAPQAVGGEFGMTGVYIEERCEKVGFIAMVVETLVEFRITRGRICKE